MGRRLATRYPRVICPVTSDPSRSLMGCRVVLYKDAPLHDIRFLYSVGAYRHTLASAYTEKELDCFLALGSHKELTDPELRQRAITDAKTLPRYENLRGPQTN